MSAGTLLILAPLFQFIAVVVDPGTWGDDQEAVSYFANPGLAQLESALYHWAWILMALAALGLMHLTRRKATVFGHIAGALAVIGYISVSGLLLTDPVEWWLGAHNSPEQSQKILDEMMNLPGVIFGFQMPWMFFAILGLPLLLVAVWRAKQIHWWVPVVVTIGYVVSFPLEYGPLTVVFWGLPVIALGSVGLKLFKMTDEEWISFYPVAPGVTTPDSYANTTA